MAPAPGSVPAALGPWVDTHCHLDAPEFNAPPGRDQIIADARLAGVGLMVVPGVSRSTWPDVAATCQRFEGLAPAYGIHPLYTPDAEEGDLAALAQQLAVTLDSERPPVAVGEIGLDGYVPGLDPQRQEAFLVAQLKLAREFGLPVILHVRRAVDGVIRLLRRHRVRGGIAHAFNGSRQQADILLDLGFKLGFGGTVTYSGSTRIRALAAELPETALVLETDAPDIPPAFNRTGPNLPSYLPRFGAEVALLRRMSADDLARRTWENALVALPRLADYDPPGPLPKQPPPPPESSLNS